MARARSASSSCSPAGLSYTAGAVVYALQRPDPWPATFGFHEVFHALTVVAAALHYTAIAIVVI